MNNYVIRNFFCLYISLFISCRKTGQSYSSVSNSSVQRIELKKIKKLNLSFSAIKEDENLEISCYLSSDTKLVNINSINLSINGLEYLVSINKVYYTNNGTYEVFREFEEIEKDINYQIKKGAYIIIYYNFKDSKILKIDDLCFNVLLKSNLGIINEKVSMRQHSNTFIFGK